MDLMDCSFLITDYFVLFQGFITMQTFRSILAEVDPKLSEAELDGIIAEIDEDGSGTMDFEEFCELMMTTPEDND
jgi:Ca2+-binding EF-hand superfamily protein